MTKPLNTQPRKSLDWRNKLLAVYAEVNKISIAVKHPLITLSLEVENAFLRV